ncbi:hypothetical protein TrispH2_011509 [Trichoplax sp. H2]|nr:hypothetical protein TrispH2_011509 [Trichoplax sp. H2]|eukprot:RDD36241.1 hypothetical protein TrispH2_011509 [Trichoplax sp. H2]
MNNQIYRKRVVRLIVLNSKEKSDPILMEILQ